MADFRAGQTLTADALNSLAQPGTELIETKNLASDSTFTNIPQDFTHLLIEMYGGISGSTADVAMRINSDSGTNYYWWRHAELSDGTSDNFDDPGVTAIRVCTWHGVGSRNHCIISINDYSGSHWQGALSSFGGSGGSPSRRVGSVMGHRNVSEPVNSVGFFVIGGDNAFSDQTIGSLYGLR